MDVMDGPDAATITGEALSSPMHVGALLIFTPPLRRRPAPHRRPAPAALVGGGEIDPRLRRRPHIGVDTLGMWTRGRSRSICPEHMQARVPPPGLMSTRCGTWSPNWLPARWTGQTAMDGPIGRRPPGGRFAFIKIHHTLVDGVEGMQMITDGCPPTRPSGRSNRSTTAEHAPAEPNWRAGRSDRGAARARRSATSAVGLGVT